MARKALHGNVYIRLPLMYKGNASIPTHPDSVVAGGMITMFQKNHNHVWATIGPHVCLSLLRARVLKCCFLTASFR